MSNVNPFSFDLEAAARRAVERLDRQAASGKWEAASLLVNTGAAVFGRVPRPLPDLPDAAEPAEVRRAVWAMLRAGTVTPTEAAEIVRAFG